jgi:hypothetical protein
MVARRHALRSSDSIQGREALLVALLIAFSGTVSWGRSNPDGGAILFQETFEDNAFASRGWYDNTNLITDPTQHIPGSVRSLQVHFTVGATTPTWGLAARHPFRPTESVYLSYWVKYSATWAGSGQKFGPHEFHLLTTEDGQYTGTGFTHLVANVEHHYENGGSPVLSVQDAANIDLTRVRQDLTQVTEKRAAAGCNGTTDGYPTDCYAIGDGRYDNGKSWKASRPAFLPTPGPAYQSDWHFVEAFFRLNSIRNGIGVPDGIVRYWFDARPVIEHTNVLLRTGAHPNMKFNQFMIAPYMERSPVDQTMWVDNLTVATAKP